MYQKVNEHIPQEYVIDNAESYEICPKIDKYANIEIP